MNIAEKAFSRLFPEKNSDRIMKIRYSRAFRPYNANVKYTSSSMVFSLSREWKEVSEDIKIGLMQSLMLKVFKEKKKTINIDLYEHFLRNIGDYSKSEESDPILEESFNRVNEKYFFGSMDLPSLRWGANSFSKLGSYEYGANTITISRVLEKESLFLDYVMYHEMLHKKHKFHTKNGKSYHHTKLFREREKEFEESDIEEKLKNFLRKQKISSVFIEKRKKANNQIQRKKWWPF